MPWCPHTTQLVTDCLLQVVVCVNEQDICEDVDIHLGCMGYNLCKLDPDSSVIKLLFCMGCNARLGRGLVRCFQAASVAMPTAVLPRGLGCLSTSCAAAF